LAAVGAAGPAAHEEVGRQAGLLAVSRVVVIGSAAAGIHAGAVTAGSDAALVDDVDAALALLRAEVRPGDVVLVKASRSVGLEKLAAALLADAP
jgi:UDP-N-acetylmuramoyl-tripeptide--D-alanyl-D-alanine ligase